MHQFTLTDSKGQSHLYKVTPHPGREGTALVIELMGMAMEPLGRIVDSKLSELIQMYLEGEITGESEVEQLIMEHMPDIEWRQIAGDVRKVLMELPNPQLTIRKILKHTTRDGDRLVDDGAFDIAYQQNYLEMFKAAAHVTKINGFLGFTDSPGEKSEDESGETNQ